MFIELLTEELDYPIYVSKYHIVVLKDLGNKRTSIKTTFAEFTISASTNDVLNYLKSPETEEHPNVDKQ